VKQTLRNPSSGAKKEKKEKCQGVYFQRSLLSVI
jgi:hypothetical protein